MRISDWSSDVCSSDLPAPEAPAEGSVEQMDHGNMQGMDMEPEASSCPPEHAAMGHCTPEAEAPDKGASDMDAMDHGAPQPSDPDCPPEHAKMGHCTPKGGSADPMAGMEDLVTTSRSEEHTSELQALLGISYAVLDW